MSTTARAATVVEAHQASYADPIEVRADEALVLTGREELWDGHRWLWAVAGDGRAGWVPDDLVTEHADGPTAARDYRAIELDAARGAQVSLIHSTHGWAWCRDGNGREGWLPLQKLAAAT